VEGVEEGLGGFHPAIDGDAVDAVSFGGIGKGGSGGQGVYDALLDRSKKRCIGVGSHFDVESSMQVCSGRGMSEGVLFVFSGLAENLDW
jgi:hypothetical protein